MRPNLQAEAILRNAGTVGENVLFTVEINKRIGPAVNSRH